MTILRPLKRHLQGESKTLNGHISSETHFPKKMRKAWEIMLSYFLGQKDHFWRSYDYSTTVKTPFTRGIENFKWSYLLRNAFSYFRTTPLPPLSGVALAQVYIYIYIYIYIMDSVLTGGTGMSKIWPVLPNIDEGSKKIPIFLKFVLNRLSLALCHHQLGLLRPFLSTSRSDESRSVIFICKT